MKRYPWLLPFLLLGCATMRPAVVGPKVDLVIYPRFHQKSHALLPANTLSSIATLDIVPFLEDAGVFWPISPTTGSTTSLGASEVLKLSQSTPSIDPNRPFVLRGLKPNKNYRI